MKNNTTVVTATGTIKVTIEQITALDGTTTYRASGRRLGSMVYTRDFASFNELSKFVNRSAGQSLRQLRIRSFKAGAQAGYLVGYKDCAGDVLSMMSTK